MQAEDFLRFQMRQRIDTVAKLRDQDEFKKHEFCERAVQLWRTSHHRGEDAIRAAIEQMKMDVAKPRG